MTNPIQSIGFETPKFKHLNRKQCAAVHSFDFLVKYNEVRVRRYFMEKQIAITEKQLKDTRNNLYKKKESYVKALFLSQDKGQLAYPMKQALHFVIQKTK